MQQSFILETIWAGFWFPENHCLILSLDLVADLKLNIRYSYRIFGGKNVEAGLEHG